MRISKKVSREDSELGILPHPVGARAKGLLTYRRSWRAHAHSPTAPWKAHFPGNGCRDLQNTPESTHYWAAQDFSPGPLVSDAGQILFNWGMLSTDFRCVSGCPHRDPQSYPYNLFSSAFPKFQCKKMRPHQVCVGTSLPGGLGVLQDPLSLGENFRHSCQFSQAFAQVPIPSNTVGT